MRESVWKDSRSIQGVTRIKESLIIIPNEEWNEAVNNRDPILKETTMGMI
jgi:hypothetical protein